MYINVVLRIESCCCLLIGGDENTGGVTMHANVCVQRWCQSALEAFVAQHVVLHTCADANPPVVPPCSQNTSIPPSI